MGTGRVGQSNGKAHRGSYKSGQSLAIDAQTKGLDSKASKGQDSKGTKGKK